MHWPTSFRKIFINKSGFGIEILIVGLGFLAIIATTFGPQFKHFIENSSKHPNPAIGQNPTGANRAPSTQLTMAHGGSTGTPMPTTAFGGMTPVPTIAAVSSMPACADHPTTSWHGLVDNARGCHYDHTHNWDPASVADVLGAAGTIWGGQTVSYPWETNLENHHKHTGYKYATNKNLGCEQGGAWWYGRNCVDAFRIEYHSAGVLDIPVRMHSYYVEARVCTPDMQKCGIVRTGGWADFGIMKGPYPGSHIPVPQDPPNLTDEQKKIEPYRAVNPLIDDDGTNNLNLFRSVAVGKVLSDPNKFNLVYWSTDLPPRNQYGYNKRTSFKFWVYDDPAVIDRNNSTIPLVICPNYDCLYNNSQHVVYEVSVNVPESLDPDGDGRVTYSGFTDRQGNIASSCTAASLDCVPLRIEDAPTGTGVWGSNADGVNGSGIGLDIKQPDGSKGPKEFDVSPGNEWWIKYPN
jgi:hypothetical protein